MQRATCATWTRRHATSTCKVQHAHAPAARFCMAKLCASHGLSMALSAVAIRWPISTCGTSSGKCSSCADRIGERVRSVTHATCSVPHAASNIQRCTLACNHTPACADAALRDAVSQDSFFWTGALVFACSRKVLNDRDIVTGLKNTFPAAEARLVMTHKMPFFEQVPTGPYMRHVPIVWLGPATAATALRFPLAAGEGYYEHDNTGGHARSRCACDACLNAVRGLTVGTTGRFKRYPTVLNGTLHVLGGDTVGKVRTCPCECVAYGRVLTRTQEAVAAQWHQKSVCFRQSQASRLCRGSGRHAMCNMLRVKCATCNTLACNIRFATVRATVWLQAWPTWHGSTRARRSSNSSPCQ